MERKRIGDLILSVVMALLLWSYVINVVNPPVSVTVRDVPVVLEGRETLRANKLTISGDGYYTVDVTFSAPRAEVTGVGAADLRAQADISALSAGQNYVEVKVTGPNNISIDNISTSKIQVYVDELVTADVPLRVAVVQPEMDAEFTILDAPQTLAVTGAAGLVAMAGEVRVDYDASILEVDVPHTQNLIPVCLDSEGNVLASLELSEEKVRVEAALYNAKSVPLKLSYVGTPGLGSRLSGTRIPSSVMVKAPVEILDGLSFIKANTINIDGITQDTSYNISFQLPEGVYLAESSGGLKAKFTLTHTGEISFGYQPDQILVNNAPDPEAYRLSYTPCEVSVYASGELDVIRTLEAKDLQPVLDLSVIELPRQGETEYKVGFRVLEPREGITVSFSPLNIVVRIEALHNEEAESEE